MTQRRRRPRKARARDPQHVTNRRPVPLLRGERCTLAWPDGSSELVKVLEQLPPTSGGDVRVRVERVDVTVTDQDESLVIEVPRARLTPLETTGGKP